MGCGEGFSSVDFYMQLIIPCAILHVKMDQESAVMMILIDAVVDW